MVLAPHLAQSIVVCAGWTRWTMRPCLRAISTRAFFVAPIAASAALRAMVDFARNFGRKSSTASASWSRTTFLAHLRAVSRRWAPTLRWSFAVRRFASR